MTFVTTRECELPPRPTDQMVQSHTLSLVSPLFLHWKFKLQDFAAKARVHTIITRFHADGVITPFSSHTVCKRVMCGSFLDGGLRARLSSCWFSLDVMSSQKIMKASRPTRLLGYARRRLILRRSERRLASGVISNTSVEPLVALLLRRRGLVWAASLRNGSPLSSSCCLQTLIDSYITGPLSFSLIRSGPYWRNFRSLTRLIDWLLATV